MRASLLVLNYNGKPLLEECFGSLAAASDEGRRHDVYLIDNNSADGSADFAMHRFPWVKCVRHHRNEFLFTYNQIIPRLDTRAVLLLNNDTFFERDFVGPLLEHLHEPDVFAVNPRVLRADRVTSQGSRTSGGFNRGLWWYHQLPDIDRASTCLFALGGQAAFSREKFIELGGFDKLFWPLYHEDIDLSYRAWRRGWRVLYEPDSVVYHMGGKTSGSAYRRGQLQSITVKNTFLFQWKNIDDPRMREEHTLWLGPRIGRAAVKRDGPFLWGLHAAIRDRAQATRARVRQRSARRVSDRDAFARIMTGINGAVESGVA